VASEGCRYFCTTILSVNLERMGRTEMGRRSDGCLG
jgi:hypothetical protein